MKRLVAIAALLALAGCSLDIDRLYGTPDGSREDGGTPPRDGGGSDAGGDDDGGRTDPLALISAGTIVLASPGGDAIAAGPSEGGAVVAVSQRSSGVVSVWRVGAGSGCSLASGGSTEIPVTQPGPIAVARIDGDPYADLIVGTDTSLLVALGSTDDVYSVSSEVPHPLGALAALAIGDLDGSGTADVTLTSSGPSIGSVRQGGDGSFGFVSGPSGSGIVYRDGVAVDFDGDGALDLAAISASSVTTAVVIRGNGTGGLFGPTSDALPASASRLATWPGRGGSAGLVAIADSEIWIGGLEADVLVGDVRAIASAQLRDVVIAELDGAAPAEIVVIDASIPAVRVFHDESGSLVRAAPDFALASPPSELVALDADRDGVDELAVLIGSQVLLLRRACD